MKENNIKLSMDLLFFYEDENGRMQALTEGGILRSGEGYALYVKPSDICYLYAYQLAKKDFETLVKVKKMGIASGI